VIGSRGRVGCNHSCEGRTANAEAHLLAFHVSTRLGTTISKIDRPEMRIRSLFKVVNEDQCAAKEKDHYPVEKPSLSRLANHPAEGVRECRRQEHNRQHLEKVCKRRGVLIGMSSIRVEKTATVRTEILDNLQCGDRALRYDLLGTLDCGGDGIVAEVHRNALPDEQQGANQCSRQQDPEQGAREINPKVAERARELPGKTTYEGNAYG